VAHGLTSRGMADDQREPKQKTLKGKENPVPKRSDFERLLKKAAKQPAKQRQAAKPPPKQHQRRGR
jgi:hypothetical protein